MYRARSPPVSFFCPGFAVRTVRCAPHGGNASEVYTNNNNNNNMCSRHTVRVYAISGVRDFRRSGALFVWLNRYRWYVVVETVISCIFMFHFFGRMICRAEMARQTSRWRVRDFITGVWEVNFVLQKNN